MRLDAAPQSTLGGDPNRMLFRSIGGNVKLAGMIEFFSIRPNLTEVVLTLDYEVVSALRKVTEVVDRFLNWQLAKIEGCIQRGGSARATDDLSPMSQRFA